MVRCVQALACCVGLSCGLPQRHPSAPRDAQAQPEDEGAGHRSIAQFEVRVLRSYPHAVDAFTEGLVCDGHDIYESTGLEGSSSLRKISLDVGEIEQAVAIDPALFGEGLALLNGMLVQLTHRSGRALFWEPTSLTLTHERSYEGEGWGACAEGQRLFVSDGSSTLRVYDAEFMLLDRVPVTLDGKPLDQLNELECVGGHIFANILGRRTIARIDASTGEVDGWVDTGGLLRNTDASIEEAGVLNGIAYIRQRDTFLLTGKRWPLYFEVQLIEAARPNR